MKRGAATNAQERLAEAAIAQMPGWADAAFDYRDVTTPIMSPMHKNVDSTCFVVEVDRTTYHLKIVHPELRAERDVTTIFAASQAVAALGVAPKALHCVPAHDAILFERLEDDWKTAKTDDLREPDIMKAAIEAKKKIHKSAPFARTWSVFEGIRELSLEMAKTRTVEGANVLWMIAAVHDIEDALKASGSDTSPCHADGVASNIMFDASNAVRLVDFDMACNTDPHYDLGILLNEAYAFDEELAPALEVYEGTFRQATLYRCRLYGIADDLYWGLWSSRMNATSARRNVEFLKYAQWRLLRCRMALQDPDFERKLRMI